MLLVNYAIYIHQHFAFLLNAKKLNAWDIITKNITNLKQIQSFGYTKLYNSEFYGMKTCSLGLKINRPTNTYLLFKRKRT